VTNTSWLPRLCIEGSWKNIVGRMTGLWTGQARNYGLIYDMGKRFLFFPKRADLFCGSSFSLGIRCYLPRSKVAMSWDPPVSFAEANEGAVHLLLHMPLWCAEEQSCCFMLGCEVRAWFSSLLNIWLCGFIAVTKMWVIYASMHKVVV